MSRLPRLRWLGALLALLAAACHLAKEEKTETVITFDRLYDSLKDFDDVVIVLKNPAGDTIDVVFRGKVDDSADLRKLKAPHWDGTRVIVSITGTKGGVVGYQVETRFDPGTGVRDNIIVRVSPDAALSSTVAKLNLLVGDSLVLPPVSIIPSDLADTALIWTTAPPGLLALGPGYLKAVQAGEAELSTSLRSIPSVKLSIPVTISVSGVVPQSISIEPDSLELPANGPAAVLTATISPSAASPAVSWRSSDTAIAVVDSTGRVTGKRQGAATVTATSKERTSVSASIPVNVTGPIPVARVVFARESLDVLVGAGAESLMVSVLPIGADPSVRFSLSDSTIARVQAGKITGISAGTLSVIAVSVSNPAAKDTLIVRIAVPVANDTIPPGKPLVRVNPAGPTRELRPTWSWTSGGGGSGNFQISMDRSVFDSTATSLADTSFRPAGNLPVGTHVLYVRERDAAGNWSLAGSAQVEIDTAGPSAPKIVGTSPTSELPRWTWSSGGGGSGFYRFRLGDAAFPPNAPESRDTAYALTSAASGTTYTLYVQERDAAGNWSPAASLPIKYDLTKPTVSIVLPQSSGTFITAADTVRVSGTSAGPNGIAKVEYSLNGGAASPLTPGGNGSWAIPSLTLPNAMTTVIKVVATDSLGNQGEASLSVLRDSDPPTPPVSLSTPASPTNVATAAWTWAAGSDGISGSGLSGRYRWKLNAGAWTEVSTASATGVALAEGSNTFSVQEQDRAGNWSDAATGTVILDTRPPAAVTFTGIDSGYTDDATPTWTWTPSASNGGIAAYVLKLDGGAEFDWTSTSFTPTTALSDNAIHTLIVKQKDQVEGVTGTAKSFSYRVKVNPPAAPVVRSAAGTANNLLTNNPRFTWVSGGGGNGTYRVRINTEAAYRTHPQPGLPATEWSLAGGDADGTYTIHVSERDDMGRWSPEGDFTIRLDRTGPVYTEVFFKGTTMAVRDSFVTNLDSITISYKADGSLKELGCKLNASGTRTDCSVNNTDGLGNASTLRRYLFRRQNVVFFKPAGTGSKNGTSWENARDDLAAYLALPEANGKQLWLASGNYAAQDLQIFFSMPRIYGGFNANAFPIDTLNRIIDNTFLGTVSVFNDPAGALTTFDAVRFSGGIQIVGKTNLKNCQSTGAISISENSPVTATNVELTGVGGYGALGVYAGSNLTWDGGNISGNVPTDSASYAIKIAAGSVATFKGNLTISGNRNPKQFDLQILNEGTLTISSPVSFNCRDVLNQGTGSCLGNPLP